MNASQRDARGRRGPPGSSKFCARCMDAQVGASLEAAPGRTDAAHTQRTEINRFVDARIRLA